MLFLALVLRFIAYTRGVCVIATIIFLIMWKKSILSKFAFATSVLFIVEFLLGFIANFTWWPFILAMIFAIIYMFAKGKN